MIPPTSIAALSVVAVEYTDCTSAVGLDPHPMRPPVGCRWRPVRRNPGG